MSMLLTVSSLSTAVILSKSSYAATCGGVEVAILECTQGGGDNIEDSGLWGLLIIALNIMAGLVGVVAVGGIVYGAILYASAQDNASQVQEAVGVIRNVVIGVVLFMGMYALLQFLVPGGVF